jgi:hypothetical protein
VNTTHLIEELLFEHDCVILPGFGGFVCNPSPAWVNPKTHTFFPPNRKLSFNRNLKNNDGLLINSLAGRLNLTFSGAREEVLQFVSSLEKMLEEGTKKEFGNLGSFTKNTDGNIVFEPNPFLILEPDSFGFSRFSFPPIKSEGKKKEAEKKFKDRQIPVEKKIKIRKTRKTARWVALALLLPIMAGLIWIPWQTNFMENNGLADYNPFKSLKESPVFSVRTEGEVKALGDLVQPFTNTAGNEAGGKILVPDENGKEVVVKESAPVLAPADKTGVTNNLKNSISGKPGNYNLIAGAFMVPENAHNYVSTLRELGLQAEIMELPGNPLKYVR